MERRITRKRFLEGATTAAVAAACGAIAANAAAADPQARVTPILPRAAASTIWPWPYTQLDQEDIRNRGHKYYYDGGCAYGALAAIVSALQDKIGDPYTQLPSQLMYFGGGGGAGWGTLCGALNGSAVAISLVLDRTTASSVVGELFGWYTTFAFPSDISNDRAVQHGFLVNKYDKALTQSVSDSPLCHASVTNWCYFSGFKSTAAERSERCARLTGDVAAKAVEMLNQASTGTFKATFVPARSVTGCLGCHDNAVVPTVKMDCEQCHKDNWQHLY